MNLRRVRTFSGPNLWAACPIVEVTLAFDGESEEAIRRTCDRLRDDFSDLPAEPSEAPASLRLVRAFAWVAADLQRRASTPVAFTTVRLDKATGELVVAVEFAAEPVGRAAVEAAWRLVTAAHQGLPSPLAEELPRLQDVAAEQFPIGPTAGKGYAGTRTIYLAARARGIPAERLSPGYAGCLRLGQGAKQHLTKASEPDTVSGLSKMTSTDKHLAKRLLHAVGVPVPEGRVVTTAEAGVAAAAELGLPVAIKPLDTDIALGVSLDLRSQEQVEAAFGRAREHSEEVLVERFAPGLEHRVLVIGNRVVAVCRIDPPHVIGDGTATVAELVERVNRDPRRAPDGPLNALVLDAVAETVLAAQGHTRDSVPPAGMRVLVRRNPPYFSQGGTLVDLTDAIHPVTAAHAVAAAQLLQIPVAGLDVVAVDIRRPLEEQRGVVVEINASPGLWLHLAPWNDNPRPVGEAFIELLYPSGADGRIPVVGLVGAAARRAGTPLTALLAAGRLQAGRVSETEAAVGGRRWTVPAGPPRDRAAVLFHNPTVDVALLDTTAAELTEAGFGNDRCTVAIMLDDTASDATSGDALRVLGHALGLTGILVLATEHSSNEVAGWPIDRLILVGGRADHPRVRRHLADGGRVLLADGDTATLVQGATSRRVLGTLGRRQEAGTVPDGLAALAAAVALGLSPETLTSYLERRPVGDLGPGH